MASTPTLVYSESFTADGTSFVTTGLTANGWVPSASVLDLVAVTVVDDGAAVPGHTISGNGITWGLVTDGTTNTNQTDTTTRQRFRLFRVVSGTGTTGELTISCGAVTCERAHIAIYRISESSIGDVVQVVKNNGSGTDTTLTLASPADVANLLMGFFTARNPSLPTWSDNTGWTNLVSDAVEADMRVAQQYHYNVTNPGGTLGTSTQWVGVAIEIDNVPSGGGGGAATTTGLTAAQRAALTWRRRR